MKLKVKKIYIKNVSTKFGNKDKVSVHDGERWYDLGFANSETNKIKEGSEIEGTVTTREYNGKTYYEFHLPKKEDIINAKLDKILEGINKILATTNKF